MYMQKYN